MKEETHELEMEFMMRWCTVVLDFIEAKNVGLKEFSELTKENMNKHYKSYSPGLYKGFKQAYGDINEMAKALPPSDYRDLNIMLKDRFGQESIMILSTTDKKIASIVKKGKISNASEYGLLLNRVDEIYAEVAQKDELEKLNMLLTNYQKKDIPG